MKKEESAIISHFILYQNSFFSIIEKLKDGYQNGRFKDWKGFITINGPVVFQPEILFVGINPGPGLYNEINCNDNGNRVPFRILNGVGSYYRDESVFPLRKPIYRSDGKTIALDWFIKSNYRDESAWYGLKTKPGNNFVGNMIKIICKVAYGLGKGELKKGVKPEWYDTFGKQIMFLNVCPFATNNLAQLNLLKKELGVDEWKDIVMPIRVLVKEFVKPKVIVFAGVAAYNYFMWEDKGNKIFDIPVIVIDRKRGYNSEENLSGIASEIVEALRK
jgi:hypothetical protein